MSRQGNAPSLYVNAIISKLLIERYRIQTVEGSAPFQVSEWIVHVIISQATRSGRRSVLNCLLRLAQVSWNIGNLNGVMEILMGLR